tara:strand:- start:1717 stop:1866 length:150 start_codon:yes stop_codon:yes gene_type:complete
MSKSTPTRTLTAANDNPGGATSVEMKLSSIVTVMAKAYVAKAQAKEGLA